MSKATDKGVKHIQRTGIKKLADESTVIAAHNWHRSLVEIRQRIEDGQRFVLKPLLDKAATVIRIYEEWGIPLLQFEELKKELESWRMRR